MHEPINDTSELVIPSERSFGLVFALVFSVWGGLRLWRHHPDGFVLFGVAAVFAALALFHAAPLRPLNRLWARFGALLHGVVTPVLMGLIFFGALMPMGLLMRLMGKDLLRLRRDAAATSYWLACPDAGARTDTMKDQF